LIVLDTSVAVAYFHAADRHHERVADWIDHRSEELVTTPLTVAELDYFVTLGGAKARAALYTTLRRGGLRVDWWPEAMTQTLDVAERHGDLGLTDASLVALATRLGTNRIATLDERHFRPLRPLTGEPAYTLLPADADKGH
jgi:predicted nucleic acid-binding protein